MSVAELAEYPQWVVAYLADKIPLNPNTGQQASVSDSATWSDYATAVACVNNKPGLIAGFVLSPNDPYVCVDLDSYKTNDSAILNIHKAMVESFNTYSEISPQGGVHLWCKGSLESGRRSSENYIEVYPHGRYITVTGNVLNPASILERQELLTQLVDWIGEPPRPLPATYVNGEQTKTDEEILNIAANAVDGELFKTLWLGKWDGLYTSQSEADLALVNILAFYTDNKEQVARMYYNSNLFKLTPDKNKKKRKAKPDYLFNETWGLITKAFDQKIPTVYYSSIEKEIKAKLDHEAREGLKIPILDPKRKLQEFVNTEGTDFTFDELPPGMVGEIALFIYQNAFRPVKEIAIAAAVAFMAGLCGKTYNVSKTGLNQYIAVLAPTAGGKEAAASGMGYLTAAVMEKFPAFERFIGPSEIASPQALVKHLATTSSCFVSHKAEIGFWLQKLTNKWAKQNEVQLRGLLLDLYTKSGAKQVVRGTIYSDRTKNIGNIEAPGFTLFGDSTPDQFYKAIDEENVDEGLVARFTVIETSNEDVPFNRLHGQILPDPYLVDRIVGLARHAMQLSQVQNVTDVKFTVDAEKEHEQFMHECYSKAREDTDSAECKLYSRAHLRLLKMAALIAVGINPDNPIVDVHCIRWAKGFILKGLGAVANRFESGRVGEVNYKVEQQVLIARLIRKYYKGGYREGYAKAYGIDEGMYQSRIITHRYFTLNTNRARCFRNDHNAQMALKNILNELCDSSILMKSNLMQVRNQKQERAGICYYITDVEGLAKDR